MTDGRRENPRVIVLAKINDRHLNFVRRIASAAALVTCPDEESALTHAVGARAIATWGWTSPARLVAAAKDLEWIHSLSAGVEGLLIPEILDRPITLTNSRGVHGLPIAEHVLALILAFTRGLVPALRYQRERRWERIRATEVGGKTLGLIGLGGIGRQVAQRASVLGMRVIALRARPGDRTVQPPAWEGAAPTPDEEADKAPPGAPPCPSVLPPGVDRMLPPDKLPELLAASDFVVVAVPLTDRTRGFIGEPELALMKPDAILINIARGGVVDEPALINALKEGRLGGAGLDVFRTEPLPPESEFWGLENVIVTPHIAASSPYLMDRAWELFARNLERFIEGKELLNQVDKVLGY
ncbi:MAG: D-2-hydroxyacid dehydrogenase [Actinobacteria bacterium]|nr:D-2-hydroxyacid dehydrogenase [Actinomycetota bacterium]